MNEEITTFEGLKEEVAKIEGFVEKLIPFNHPEPSLSPVEGERIEFITSISDTGNATGVPSPAPAATPPVSESAPSAPVHVLETRSFGRQSADHPMVINVTRGAL